jgi:hypothetical protein
MGHNDVWASHPANYGKGSRRWCVSTTRRDARLEGGIDDEQVRVRRIDERGV